MYSEIIVDVNESQTKVALLEDGELVEMYMEHADRQSMTGNIYLGKVEKVVLGLQAVFIDIGYEKSAYLYMDDIINEHPLSSIYDVLTEGQDIVVQVVKEPIGNKGPRVTTNITLPGKYFVLLPYMDYIGVSKKIESQEEQERLKKMVQDIRHKNMGLIIRTDAEGKEKSELIRDFEFLLKLWDNIQNKRNIKSPDILYQDLNLLKRSVRDIFTDKIDKFVINDKNGYEEVREMVQVFCPSWKEKVEFFNKDCNIFQYYNIEGKLNKALGRKVWLKSGGYIVIDRLEALTAIDVNTGKCVYKENLEETVRLVNREAAREIARQIRLRNIGGIIIIDFIDIMNYDQQEAVLNELMHYLKRDRTKTTVMGITRLGLVEMTRKRR